MQAGGVFDSISWWLSLRGTYFKCKKRNGGGPASLVVGEEAGLRSYLDSWLS